MKNFEKQTKNAVILISFMVFFFTAGNVYAHCDTLEGPVVETAKKALVSGDVTPLLKWVAADDEQMIHTAFQKTLDVRKLGAQAQDLADMYFFETLVRIHRAGEGAPYTGLKPGAAVDPAVALADKALESGSVDKLVNILSDATAKGIRERFHRALKAKKHADESVTAGREFVESYVIFTHYIEGLHSMIKGASEHHEHK
jgi:Family of unknown function (DUF6448)